MKGGPNSSEKSTSGRSYSTDISELLDASISNFGRGGCNAPYVSWGETKSAYSFEKCI